MNRETRLIWIIVITMLLVAAYALYSKAHAEERYLHLASTKCICLDYFCTQQRCYRSRARALYPRGRRYDYRRDSLYQEEADLSPRCKGRMAREGVEKYQIEDAKESAKSMLQEAIRRHHGGKYMDPANWKEVEFDCGLSSTGNRGSEKTAGTLTGGGALQQCTIYAKPCRGIREDGSR